MRVAWFEDTTWCLCEPPRDGMVVSGPIHECTAERRLHRHRFSMLIAEETDDGRWVATIFRCSCRQERRLELGRRT